LRIAAAVEDTAVGAEAHIGMRLTETWLAPRVRPAWVAAGPAFEGEQMKLSVLLAVNAAIAAAFGLGFVLVPAEVVATYGVALPAGSAVVARLFGAMLVGQAVLSWQARAAGPSEALRAIVLGFFVAETLGFVLAVHAVVTGAVNVLGWSTVAIYAFLAAGFGVFAFGKSAVTAPA